MEDSIGKVWDRFLSRRTDTSYESERVYFNDKSKSLKVFYHLLGGDKGKELGITDKRSIKTERSLLEKISGAGQTFYLAWQDEKGLYLPESLAFFPDKNLNMMLYYWLVAMATQSRVTHANLQAKNEKAIKNL